MKVKRLALIGLSLVLLMAMSPLNTQFYGRAQTQGGTLNLIFYEPSFFNPLLEFWNLQIRFVYNGLIDYDANGNPVGGLAESWDFSPDGLNYTFNLRHNVTWHDGQPFTSADVQFTFQKLLDPKVGSPIRGQYGAIDNNTILTPDNYTVQFNLKHPAAELFQQMFRPGIMPKHIWAKEDIHTSFYNYNPVGTGPFKFIQWKKGDHIEYAANPDYYKGRPYLDRLIVKTIPDAAVALTSLDAGDYQSFLYAGVIGSVPYEQVSLLKQNPNLQVVVVPSTRYFCLYFNLDKQPWNDIRVRQAFIYALDRQYMVDSLSSGYGFVDNSTIPHTPGTDWAYNPDVTTYPRNITKAKELLAEAGYPNGFSFRTICTTGVREQLYEIIKSQVAQIGITMTWDDYEWTSFRQMTADGKFDIHCIYTTDLIDPIDNDKVVYASTAGNWSNTMRYKNPQLDKLLIEASTTANRTQRAEIIRQVQKILSDDVPSYPLYVLSGIDVWNKKFEGWFAHSLGYGGVSSIEGTWLETAEETTSSLPIGWIVAAGVAVVVIAVGSIYVYYRFKGKRSKSVNS